MVGPIDNQGKWVKRVIWGGPIGVSVEEIKANLKGGTVKDVWRLQVTRKGVRKDRAL